MRDDLGFGLADKRVTLSTAGLVPMIDKLSAESDVSLAVSLHAANDELRTELVPLNKRYPLAELMAACERYINRAPRTSITFEYTLMKGVNDKPEHARQLIKFMRRLPGASKVNLIPFNPFPGARYERSGPDEIRNFQTQSARCRRPDHGSPYARRRHRCRLWPAEGAGGRPYPPTGGIPQETGRGSGECGLSGGGW